MTLKKSSFPTALRTLRKARGLSQEAFSEVSSRTYLSSLERGLKVPTISKVDQLCEVLDVHPLTLYVLSYAGKDKSTEKVIAQVQRELAVVHAEIERKKGDA